MKNFIKFCPFLGPVFRRGEHPFSGYFWKAAAGLFTSPSFDKRPASVYNRSIQVIRITQGRGQAFMAKETILFSNGREMGAIREGNTVPLPSQRYERYCQAEREIRRQHQWKKNTDSRGSLGFPEGFLTQMGYPQLEDQAPVPRVGGMALLGGTLYYTLQVGGVGGLYTKDPAAPEKQEGVIVHRQGMLTRGLSWNGASFAVTVEDGPWRHLGFLTLPRGELTVVTEGDTVEEGPSWSRDLQRVWFSSAGCGRDAAGASTGLGPAAICRLDANTMELAEVYCSSEHRCLSPREGADGSLYFLRRPLREEKESHPIRDAVLAPGKVAKAVGGWLDLFTQRYAGETLRSGGDAKAKQKSQEELVIEGNLINVRRTLEENQSRGEKHPGLIPHSWELVRLAPGGKEPESIKKGILAYTFLPGGGLVLSNGRHILSLSPDGREELLAEQPMVTMLETGW